MTERKRRAPGEGSIDTLPSGRKRIRLTTAAGGRVTLHADTDEEAEALRRGAVTELADGDLAPVGALTLRTLGPKALDARELAGGRNTRSEWSIWRRHLLTAPFVDWPLADVLLRNVRAWVKDMAKKRAVPPGQANVDKAIARAKAEGRDVAAKSPRKRAARAIGAGTVKHALDLLRAIFQAAVDDELIAHNPAHGVKPPTPEARPDEPWAYLEPQQQVRLLTCRDVPAWGRLLVAFALGTGLRQGEQWNLELRDLHVRDADPHVVVRFGSHGKVTKGGRSRVVPLFGLALEAARQWVELLPTFAASNPHGLVFPTPRGCRRQRSKPPKGWRRWLLAAGITEPFRWHDLRHTCASSLLAGWWGHRWTLEEVRNVLGHRSVTTTERYAHLAPSVLAAAARATTLGAAPGREPGRSRDGHAPVMGNLLVGPQGPDITQVLDSRATVDSNHWPSAPEARARGRKGREKGHFLALV